LLSYSCCWVTGAVLLLACVAPTVGGPRFDPDLTRSKWHVAAQGPGGGEVWINVGRGTTATHSTFDAACSPGIPKKVESLHFGESCTRPGAVRDIPIEYTVVDHKPVDAPNGLRYNHKVLVMLYKQITHCLELGCTPRHEDSGAAGRKAGECVGRNARARNLYQRANVCKRFDTAAGMEQWRASAVQTMRAVFNRGSAQSNRSGVMLSDACIYIFALLLV
jgi:hypothetical protein